MTISEAVRPDRLQRTHRTGLWPVQKEVTIKFQTHLQVRVGIVQESSMTSVKISTPKKKKKKKKKKRKKKKRRRRKEDKRKEEEEKKEKKKKKTRRRRRRKKEEK
jgi:hypothetical protein